MELEVTERISRLLDQLESSSLSAAERVEIQEKIQLLQELSTA